MTFRKTRRDVNTPFRYFLTSFSIYQLELHDTFKLALRNLLSLYLTENTA